MSERIQLDSPAWDTDHWHGVDDPRDDLAELLQADNPQADKIECMLEGTYYVDNPSPHFYYLIPYVLDIFEQHPSSSAVRLFCTYLHRAKDGRPSEQCMQQLDDSRPRIIDLLMHLYKTNCSPTESTRDDCQWILAALATASNQSDLGRQIIAIDKHQHIN